MSIKLSEIAKEINAEMSGKDIEIKGVCGVDEAFEGCLTWAENDKNFKKALASPVSAVIINSKDKASFDGSTGSPLCKLRTSCPVSTDKSFLLVENPRLAFAKSIYLFAPKHKLSGIHNMAVISSSAKIGKNAAIGPNVVIADNVKIGDDAKIYAGCYIGDGASIGNGILLYPNVTIMDKIIIGNNVIIHSGAVIGADGFGYVKDGSKHIKIPQIGTVVIEDDVEIGANTCIDRATTSSTKIGRGTKIDNLIHLAHNVEIGQDCIIVAMTGIAGSSKVGDRTILAAKVGVSHHIKIGSDAMVLGRAGVTKDIPSSAVVSGFPAQNHRSELKYQSYLSLLPKTIETLKKRIDELEKK